jgi:hypothetical protein
VTGRGLVSCLCVTEGRSAFIPWLLWGYDRQTWRDRELIIVDSSPAPWRTDRPDVRVIAAPPGTNVPTKRNVALAAASGTWAAWFDDDDWQHPQRLALLVQALADDPRATFAGGTRSFFVDLHGHSCRNYDGYGTIIFNGAGFRREAAQAVRFNEAQRRASDSGWMQAVAARGGRRLVAPQILTAWLSHEQNISNDRKRWRFPLPLSALRDEVGGAMWADTDARLAALRSELPVAGPLPSALPIPVERTTQMFARGHQRGPRPRQVPGNLAAHRHASRSVLRAAPTGGVLARPESQARPLVDAEAQPPFSAVVCFGAAETERARAVLPQIERLMGRAPQSTVALVCAEPGEDRSGPAKDPRPWESIVPIAVGRRPGPTEPAITREALLNALERADQPRWTFLVAASDAVLDAGPTSWLEPALGRLRADPDLVVLAIPNGGVRGARGSARGTPPGLRGATWDSRLRLWRGRGVTGVAFIADRARLRDALRTRETAGDMPAPLATVLEEALGATTTARSFGTLAAKEAWTRRSPPSAFSADLGSTPERQNV